MSSDALFRRGTTFVRRQCLGPGEALPWHREPFHRVTVVLSGDVLSIEYRDGGEGRRVPVTPGQVDWDEPNDRIHRAVNVGQEEYHEVRSSCWTIPTPYLNRARGSYRMPTGEGAYGCCAGPAAP